MNNTDYRKSINIFIGNNENLERLKVHLNKFNPFKVLGIDHHEVRHSNVLSWLLNPKENHKLGDIVFKKLVTSILLNPDNENNFSSKIDFNNIQINDFTDLLLRREENNVDIMAISEKNKFILLIENKIYSKEHSNQLSRYYKEITEKYNNYKILPVYLSIRLTNP